MRVDPTLARSKLAEIRTSAQRECRAGEQVVGIFALSRFSGDVEVLVLTDARVFSLSPVSNGARHLVESLELSELQEVFVQRKGVLRYGTVHAVPLEGDSLPLGYLNTKAETLDLFEETWAAARAGGRMLRLETPGLGPLRHGPDPQDHDPQAGGPPEVQEGDERVAQADLLIGHLTELGRLREAGLLTEEEFSAAKARVLGT
ncbi:SHOCT domain-containing protein [Ornithinimicrobium panacihumi]|uniref:SHOCT domain-containing protein n=1 Tax=Ornithinimicrobium panacihumi TaxID=2008449 RepID=UPI003F8A5757